MDLPGLGRPVEVYRDERDVPHVFANDEQDLFRACGFLCAQDRLWQMEFQRRVGSGRLAEVLGDRPVEWRDLTVLFRGWKLSDLDVFLRVLGLREAARRSLDAAEAESLELLQCHAAGVNSWIERAGRRLPHEFRLLGFEPEPWTPVDSLAIVKLMGWQLSVSWRLVLVRALIRRRFGPQGEDRLSELFPSAAPFGSAAILRLLPDDAAEQATALLRIGEATHAVTGWTGTVGGSNCWAAAGSATRSGGAILANDPHLGFTAPSTWYQARLRGGSIDAIGSMMPGVPWITIGRTAHVAWGFTNGMVDDVDVFLERLDDEHPDRYLFQDSWRPLSIRVETVNIRGASPRKVRLRSTHHGPILSDCLPDRGTDGEVLALSWTGHHPSGEPDAALRAMRAATSEEFVEAFRSFGAPAQNLMWADATGRIGYHLVGFVPRRRSGIGAEPVPGWTGDHEWEGFLPYDELPAVTDPECGYLVTANNRHTDAAYPHYITAYYEPPYRAERIHELLQPMVARAEVTADRMEAIQADVLSIHARALVPYFLIQLGAQPELLEPPLRRAMDLLGGWDFRFATESVPAAIYRVMLDRLLRDLFEPVLGEELYQRYVEIVHFAQLALDGMLTRDDSHWVPAAERARTLRRALRSALWHLEQRYGPDPAGWRWGRLHTQVDRHALGEVPLLGRLFSVGPFEAPGDSFTVNAGMFSSARPFANQAGPSCRHVLDLGAPDESRWVLPTGNSGDPLSPHYGDDLERWLAVQGAPLRWAPREMQQGELLLLVPEER